MAAAKNALRADNNHHNTPQPGADNRTQILNLIAARRGPVRYADQVDWDIWAKAYGWLDADDAEG